MSSRPSSIDYGRRRAACIAPEAVTVYHWEGGGITDTFVFDADDAGLGFVRPLPARVRQGPTLYAGRCGGRRIPPRDHPPSLRRRSARGAGAQARVVLPRHALHSCPAGGARDRGAARRQGVAERHHQPRAGATVDPAVRTAKGPGGRHLFPGDREHGLARSDQRQVPERAHGQHAEPQRSPAILFPGPGHQDQPAGEDAAARHGALRPVYPE